VSRPYDEAYGDDGRARPHYAELLDGISEPGRLAATVKERVRSRGITFGGSPDGFFNLDPVPRILPEEEWSELQIGIAQRLRALDAFVADVYGDGRIFEAGVVPRRAVESSAHYEPAMVGALAPGRWVAIAGLDVVRSPDGRWRVIEDQVRMPSGLAYAVAARETMRALLPLNPPLGDVSVGFGELSQALRGAAPAGVEEPTAVVLCEGPRGGGWWEHERLSRELCAPAVTLADLEHRDGRLVAWLDGRPRTVDVVLHRTDDDRFSDARGRLTAVGEALLGPCSAGRLACVNAPGAGVSDDKLVHAYVEEMVRFYLGEEPLLPSVRSYDLGDEEQLAGALERLDELVIKPRGEMGGEGVVIWRHADADTRRRVRAALERDPGAHVAQELVALSVHPTVCGDRLEPRHVDLRPYALLSDEGVRILPGGLSRVALERGSLVVNSGQGGGAKDTWVPA
jgi:carboxylate-amine ligase